MSKVIWDEDLTDLSKVMFADLCEGRVKPWEYLPVYPDFRRMSLIRAVLMLDTAIDVASSQTSLVKLYAQTDTELLQEVYDRVNLLDPDLNPEESEISFSELLDDLFEPFTKHGVKGLFIIKYDTHNGILPGIVITGEEKCPYPVHPFMLEQCLRNILPGYRFVKSSSGLKELYVLPSGKPRYYG